MSNTPRPAPVLPPGLCLLTRAECGLCEQMLHEIAALRLQYPAIPAVTLVDVDVDAALRRRWGLRVPALLLDGSLICSARLDGPELLRVLRL